MSRKIATSAKISRPRLSGLVARERLYDSLDRARNRRLIWITAQPGAGKTALMAGYLDSRRADAIWYQVDSGDSDPATFFYYLRQAAIQVSNGRGGNLPFLTPEYRKDVPGFARRFFRALCSRLPAIPLLVFDNYQDVPESSELGGILAAAVEELPAVVCIVVISRSSAGPDFAKLIASRELAPLAWDDLRFTLQEAEGIALLYGQPPSNVLRMLHRQSDGWAAGLILMLERLRQTGRVNRLDEPETMEVVFNYFAGQVFALTPPTTQDILMRTAFLPRMTVRMANEVSANDTAGAVLEDLFRRHLFTDRRHEEELIYQYHALFRAFLLNRAGSVLPLAEQRRIQKRAADLLKNGGYASDAVTMYLAAEDWLSVAGLVLENAPALLAQGRGQTVAEWILKISNAHQLDSPWLLYWLGASGLQTDPVQARMHLEKSFAVFDQTGDRLGQTLSVATIVETYYFEAADFSALDRWIPVLEELLGNAPEFPSAESELRAYSGMLMATFYRQPAHPMLEVCAEKVLRLLDGPAGANEKVTAGFFLFTYSIFTGNVQHSSQIVSLIRPILDDSGVTALNQALWLSRLFLHNFLRCEYEQADKALEKAFSVASANGLRQAELLLCFMRILIATHSLDVDTVEAMCERAEAVLEVSRRMDRAYLHFGKGVLAMLRGDRGTEVSEKELALALMDETGLYFMKVLWRAALAELHADLGQDIQARRYAEEAAGLIKGTYLVPEQSWLALINSQLALRRGELDHSDSMLREGLALARRTGYFLYMPPRLPNLLSAIYMRAISAGIEVAYVRNVIRRGRLPPPSTAVEDWPWPVQALTLGGFQLLGDGEPIVFSGKPQHMPLEFLRTLIALGGCAVRSRDLADCLWPDADGDAAERSFSVTLHRLRKLLGNDAVIVRQNNAITIDPKLLWVDAFAFEELVEEISMDPATVPPEKFRRVLGMYKGKFLPQETSQAWAMEARERIHAKFMQAVRLFGGRLERAGQWAEAREVYQRALETDNLSEEMYRRLMLCHLHQGQQAEALRVYRRCKEMLSIVLGVQPSSETQDIYRSCK